MKSKLLLTGILFFLFSLISILPSLASEPVPGAEILIEQEANDVPIARVVTNKDGEFSFTFPEGIKIPKNGTFKITVLPPKNPKGSIAKNLLDMEKQTIRISFNQKDGPKFKYVLTWDVKLKTKSNRGGFAVSGKSTS
jgi:hypothetical protein